MERRAPGSDKLQRLYTATLHIVLLEDGNGSIELPSTCGAQMVVILLGTWADDQLRKLYWLDSHIVDAQNTTLHHVSSSAALDRPTKPWSYSGRSNSTLDLPSILRWPTVSLPPLNAMSEQSNLEDLRIYFIQLTLQLERIPCHGLRWPRLVGISQQMVIHGSELAPCLM